MQYGSVNASLFVKVNFLTNRKGRKERKGREKFLSELY
jgi:hypothetical protein